MTTVVVAGAVANKPHNAGEAWVRMSWVEGLRRLGVDVWFVEELSAAAWGAGVDAAVRWFDEVATWFGVADRCVLLDADSGDRLRGTVAGWGAVTGGADLLVNISGHARDRRVVDACHHRAYVDIDPGYTQIWHLQGADLELDRHDRHFSVGLNIGTDRSGVPTAGFAWTPVLPPVVLDQWPVTPPPPEARRLTTIASWRGGFGTLTHDGRSFGPKAHQFRRFVELPQHVDATFELALAIDPADEGDRARLLDHGWRLVEPRAVAGTPQTFADYVRGSAAEFSVAQTVYTELTTGWFSDRTARYLATGRPAVVQSTGIDPALTGAGAGIVTFVTPAEAETAIAGVLRDPDAAAGAARAFAERHLAHDTLIPRFLDQCGIS